jgi:hypothetical protein
LPSPALRLPAHPDRKRIRATLGVRRKCMGSPRELPGKA